MKVELTRVLDALLTAEGTDGQDQLPWRTSVGFLKCLLARDPGMAEALQLVEQGAWGHDPDQLLDWAAQASLVAQNQMQGTSRAVQGTLAGQSRAGQGYSQGSERGRAVVEVSGQGERPAGEVRALELLRAGYSERPLLAALKTEGLKLDKTKMKLLRQEVATT